MGSTFQFQTRTLLTVIALVAIGLALSVNAPIGARLAFLAGLSFFWIGIACVTVVVDARSRGNLGAILTLMFGQAMILASTCVIVVSLGTFLRTLISPWLIMS